MSKLHFVTYGDEKYVKQRKMICITAKQIAKVSSVFSYSEKDLDKRFIDENREVMGDPKGGGLWLWKPFLILKALNEIEYGDHLLYCDCSAIFVRNAKGIVDELTNLDQSVVAYELPLIEEQWTDSGTLKKYGSNEAGKTNQLSASYILFKKDDASLNFVLEWLNICCTSFLTLPNRFNSPCISHRYDQSVFSLLYKRKNYLPCIDISQYGAQPDLYSQSNIKYSDIKFGLLYSFESQLKFRVHGVRKYPFIILYRKGSVFRYLFSYLKYLLRTVI